MNHFLIWWNSGFYDYQWQPAQWLDQEKAPKHFPKPNLHQQKVMIILFGGLLLVCFTKAFWIPVKPLYLRSMLSKLMKCTKNCNACSQHLFSRKDSSLLRNNAWRHITQAMLQKLNELGYGVLPHLPYSPALCQLTTTSSSHLGNFLQGKSFHNQQVAVNVSQEFVKPQSRGFFYATRTNKLISHWQKCVDCNGSYFVW